MKRVHSAEAEISRSDNPLTTVVGLQGGYEAVRTPDQEGED